MLTLHFHIENPIIRHSSPAVNCSKSSDIGAMSPARM